MLESRNIVGRNHSQRVSAALSPLLWSLVMDVLLWRLNNECYNTVGNADNMAILIIRKYLQTVSEILQSRTNLSMNPNKMVIIPSTVKINLKGLKEPTLFNRMTWLTIEIKYFGLTLDKGLT
jgi:hypothetical protein